MDTTAPSLPHALSGHNPTLFNVVLQYADMDMLRALVLTSQSMYKTLQHCRFDHLTMVVLEAPILDAQQQIIYNGANPVPADTFELPLKDAATTSGLSKYPRDTNRALCIWKGRSKVHNDYNYNLTIPDYARNFMARACSVELVVYRLRLGTRISTYFIDNAHALKYGRYTTLHECPTCVESNTSIGATTTQHNSLHMHCLPTPHTQSCDPDCEHMCGDIDCIFSKHCSRQYESTSTDEEVESRRFVFHTPPVLSVYRSHYYPFDRIPSLELNFVQRATDHHRDSTRFSATMHSDGDNTQAFDPRLHNLPLVEQQAPTTSLKIRVVEFVCFGVDDWTDAIPGCAIQPVQTWTIHDDPNAPQYRHPESDLQPSSHSMHTTLLNTTFGFYDSRSSIGRHFPHLTNLILQYTQSGKDNQCGIADFDLPNNFNTAFTPSLSLLSDFFIGNNQMCLPRLQHFGVIGTLFCPYHFANIIFSNARPSSLTIDHAPEPRPIHLESWLSNLDMILNELERLDTPTFGTPDPRHKYKLSLDFSSSCPVSRCPHDTLTQLALPCTDTPTGDVTSLEADRSHPKQDWSTHPLSHKFSHRFLPSLALE